MSVSLNTSYMKNIIQMKREFEDFTEENETKNDSNNSSDVNSEASDVDNNEEANNTALDYTDNTLNLYPMADLIKKEFLPEFYSNPFRNQNLAFKDSPFLLPTQLYKSFLENLGKRRRNVADCYSLYPRNMLFTHNFGPEASDDDGDRATDSPEEVTN